MSGELSLFGDDETQVSAQPVGTEAQLPGWLVDSLRAALADRGLTTSTERQQVIEVAAGRPVDSLRSLTRSEALRVLERLASSPTPTEASKSAWDARDEETWIDRL